MADNTTTTTQGNGTAVATQPTVTTPAQQPTTTAAPAAPAKPLNKKQQREAKRAAAAAQAATATANGTAPAATPATPAATTRKTADVVFYATRDEAEKAGVPAGTAKPEAWKVFGVTSPDGKTVRYFWAVGNVNALATAAKADGYVASSAGAARTASPQAAAAKLLSLTDDELKALGLTRAPKS